MKTIPLKHNQEEAVKQEIKNNLCHFLAWWFENPGYKMETALDKWWDSNG